METTDDIDGIFSSCISKPSPLHIKYVKYEERLKSFHAWPQTGKPDKKDLAEAGFFFEGPEDRTICFHCDGGLNKWTANDNPMMEHFKTYPNCVFIKKKLKKC
uniref:Uncharacterized protein n=1 Tax=Octopus bimaculoides TaxID=37653 RepID=A0A0L8IDV4_OCTBM